MEKVSKRLAQARASLAVAAVAAVGFALPAFGSTINSIETTALGGSPVSFGNTSASPTPDPTAVVTYVASQAGVALDGYTYTNYALLVNDGTGSLDVFSKASALTALDVGTDTAPVVGDAVSVAGTYSPFDAIPEVATLTTFGKLSSGNSVPGTTPVTIPTLLALGSVANYGVSEYLLELDNVTLSGASVFATHANTTLTATDASSNAVTVFQWASSYSSAGALGGQPVPTGPVDMTGICDVFGSGATADVEFVPFTVTAVPEPTSIGLLAAGGLMLLKRRARNA